MSSASDTIRKPLGAHLSELRTRLVWIGLVVTAAGGTAFAFNQQLLNIIQKPLNQTLYFTSPTGGITFIFQLCLTVGVVVAFPLIVYHAYQFLSPLVTKQKRSTIFFYITASFILAWLGVAFAYFISLPAALHFLTQFGGENIESLIKADEYFSFALAYIGGFAILFQIPLLVLLINRITPLKPSKMMKSQRWVILASFIGAALITPTPDPVNQALMAAPAILLYQVSIILIFVLGLRKKSRKSHPKPTRSFAYTKKLAKLSIKRAMPKPKKQPPKVIYDFVTPTRSRVKHTPLTRPQPVLHSSRNSEVLLKKQQRTTPLVGRRIQSIDGII